MGRHSSLQALASSVLALVSVGACEPGKFDQRHQAVPADAQDAAVDATVAPNERDAAPHVASDAAAPVEAGLDASVALPDAHGDAAADAARELDASEGASDASDASHADVQVVPVTLSLSISDDVDDAAWATEGASAPLSELLHFSTADGSPGNALEVGTDSEACRTGLRFALPIRAGARILEAHIRLLRLSRSSADSSSTMRVELFASTDMAAFDPTHRHTTPSQHAPQGLWSGGSVGGFSVGLSSAWTESPDLTVLLQHAIDQVGWVGGGHVGFLVSVDQMAADSYAQFQDSAGSADGPVLTVRYLP